MGQPSATNKDYGRRLYVSPKNYQDQITKPTDKAFDNVYKYPHSENKKPYREDSYEEMEYFQSPPFGFNWDWPDFDFPWQPTPGSGEPISPPWLLIFTCQVSGSPCWCENFEKCYTITCSHDIVEASVDPLGDPGDVGKFSVTASSGEICITGGSDADGAVRIRILMAADPGDGSVVYGEYGPILISACADEDCDPCIDIDPDELTYDNDSSADTVNRNGSSNVYVSGGVGPYTWSISGTGLSMANAQTADLQNQVEADGTACGAGDITITDACGQTVQGYIRVNQASKWGAYGAWEQVTWTPCAPIAWIETRNDIVCEDVTWRYKAQWGGPFYFASCPQSCLCANYKIYSSDGHCSRNCTYQAGARAMQYCQIATAEWECS